MLHFVSLCWAWHVSCTLQCPDPLADVAVVTPPLSPPLQEILEKLVELMMDPFGNYLIQKLLDRCSEEQRLQVRAAASSKQVAGAGSAVPLMSSSLEASALAPCREGQPRRSPSPLARQPALLRFPTTTPLCTAPHPLQVLKQVADNGELVNVALNTHGTRAVQKLIETLTSREQASRQAATAPARPHPPHSPPTHTHLKKPEPPAPTHSHPHTHSHTAAAGSQPGCCTLSAAHTRPAAHLSAHT